MRALTIDSPPSPFTRTPRPARRQAFPRLADAPVVHRPKVLVADDDVSVLRLAGTILGRHGIDVQTAGDGYAAVEKAIRIRPDVLILDVNMPAGSGFTVQERYEQAMRYRDTRVIYMSADDDDDLRKLVSRHTTSPLVVKPFNPEALIDAVLMVDDDVYALAA